MRSVNWTCFAMMNSSTRFERVYCKQACGVREEDICICEGVNVTSRSVLLYLDCLFLTTYLRCYFWCNPDCLGHCECVS